jgi:hypothetical protein
MIVSGSKSLFRVIGAFSGRITFTCARTGPSSAAGSRKWCFLLLGNAEAAHSAPALYAACDHLLVPFQARKPTQRLERCRVPRLGFCPEKLKNCSGAEQLKVVCQ